MGPHHSQAESTDSPVAEASEKRSADQGRRGYRQVTSTRPTRGDWIRLILLAIVLVFWYAFLIAMALTT